MTESPSSLLERAAARLDDLATTAVSGPWEVIGRPFHDQVRAACGSIADGDLVASVESRGTSAWLATMSPSVASPLVEWLRDAARRMESHPHLGPEGSTMQRTALEFARIVLGETP